MKCIFRLFSLAVGLLFSLVSGVWAKPIVTPIDWGVTAQCMYEAVKRADNEAVISCRDFGPDSEKVEVVREREGVTLSNPIYRFSDERTTTENGYQYLLVDVPSHIKLKNDLYLVPMEISFNTGGSGLFSTLGLGLIDPKQKKVGPTMGFLAGDRCNDGYAQFVGVKRGKDGAVQAIQWRTAMTPFRLLNPIDKTDWRMLDLAREIVGDQGNEKFPLPKSLNGWQPYTDIDNSAMSCIGWVDKEFDFDTRTNQAVGVSISVQEIRSLAKLTKAEKCAFAQIKKNLNLKGGPLAMEKFPLKEWQKILKKVESSCSPDQKDDKR